IIAAHRPVEMAVEEVFFARDPRAALKLGQARGAAIVAGVQAGLAVAEYSAKTVKLSVVGTGAATKEQVSHMVVRLLNLDAAPREDAADALAVALCHAHSLRTAISPATKVAGVGQGVAKSRYARGGLQEIQHRRSAASGGPCARSRRRNCWWTSRGSATRSRCPSPPTSASPPSARW